MSGKRLWDPIRKKWVAATPEEVVRQSLILLMTQELGYPKEFLAVEKELSELPHLQGVPDIPKRRADILCFTKRDEFLVPLMLIECKEKGLTAAARAQVIGYNHFVKAPFIALAAQEGVEVGQYDSLSHNYMFISSMPNYYKLI